MSDRLSAAFDDGKDRNALAGLPGGIAKVPSASMRATFAELARRSLAPRRWRRGPVHELWRAKLNAGRPAESGGTIRSEAQRAARVLMHCNICGGAEFTDMPKRPRVRCRDCGSLERTRVAALHIGKATELPREAHILHFAPERGLSAMLRELGGVHYRALDIDPSRYPGLEVERFDLCRDVFDLPEGRYDLIVHNHVLEHIECNYSVVLIRLARALKHSGTMLFSMPILPGEFRDELIEAPMAEKLARFGPMVHVRRFSPETLQRTIGMIFRIPAHYELRETFSEAELTEANVPPHHWSAYTGASVFRVGPGDLRC